MSRRAVSALLVLLGCGPRLARGPQPVVSPGHPSYDTDVHVDPAAGTLNVRSRLTYVADSSTARHLRLLLNRGLQLSDVRGRGVQSFRDTVYAPSPDWNLVSIELDPTISPGDVLTIELRYSGHPQFGGDSINGISPAHVELGLDSQWHPLFATLDQDMTGRLLLHLPADWRVVASGTVTRQDSGLVVENTVPLRDVAFYAAPAATVHETRDDGFTVFSEKSDATTIANVLTAAKDCGSYLNARFGTQRPLPAGKLVLVDRGGPAYARKNYIVLSRASYPPAALHYYLCHELTHYWTRDAGVFTPDHWMMEAFAEYMAVRYLRDQGDTAAYAQHVKQWEEVGRGRGPVWTPELKSRPSFYVMYRKAPFLLTQLEARIGSAAFDRFLEQYMTGVATTTPQLLELLAGIAGPAARDWFAAQLAER